MSTTEDLALPVSRPEHVRPTGQHLEEWPPFLRYLVAATGREDGLETVEGLDLPDLVRLAAEQLGVTGTHTVRAVAAEVQGRATQGCWCDEACGDPDCCGGPWQSLADCPRCIFLAVEAAVA